MITLEDCKAFCDADPDCVERLAKAESLAPIVACALAQAHLPDHPTAATPAREETSTPAPAWFRPYGVDSPEARARVVFLALLVDGEIAIDELAALNTASFLEHLDIPRQTFVTVLNALCEDLGRMQRQGDCYTVGPEQFALLFDEIRDPYYRNQLLKLIRHLIRVDGRVTSEESLYWHNARVAWQPRMGR